MSAFNDEQEAAAERNTIEFINKQAHANAQLMEALSSIISSFELADNKITPAQEYHLNNASNLLRSLNS